MVQTSYRPFKKRHSKWPGLILHSEQSQATVLAHLRRILFINFEQHSKGVLRYSNPTTASYFFPACSANELKFWLGPVRCLSWYGGSWQDRAVGQHRWFEIENPDAGNWTTPAGAQPPALNNEQQQALERQQKEYFLYQWWLQHPPVDYAQAWGWLEEGLALDFTQAAQLERYLNLRFLHPSRPAPVVLPQGTDAARLEYLQAHLQQPCSDQES